MSIKRKVFNGALVCSVLATALPSASFAAERNVSNLNKTLATIKQPATHGKVSALGGWKAQLAARQIRQGALNVGSLINKLSLDGAYALAGRYNEIADWIEKADTVQETDLAKFLVSLEIPSEDADTIAHWIKSNYLLE